MNKTRSAVLFGMILLAAASRLVPHPPNFAPIAAMALFAGAHFSDRRIAFLAPVAALLLSDLVLGFYGLMSIVYACFALIVLIGFSLREKCTPLHVGGAALGSSVLFFIITNFGVWAFGSLYPKTIEGLVTCYIAALPFFHNTLLGDAFYTAVLFGGFALAERKVPAVRLSHA